VLRNVLSSTNKRVKIAQSTQKLPTCWTTLFTIGRNMYISLCHQRCYQIYKPTAYRKSSHSFKSGAQIKNTWRYTPICIPTSPIRLH